MTGPRTADPDTRAAENVARVARMYEAFGRGVVPAVLAGLADDVRWEEWGDNHAQRAGVAHLAPRRGPDEVSGFFGLLGTWRVLRFDVLDVLGSGRQVAAELHVAFELPDGQRLEDEEIHLWTFDEAGRVVRFRHYVDTAKHIAVTTGG